MKQETFTGIEYSGRKKKTRRKEFLEMILKHIEFRFPVFYEGQTLTCLDWDSSEALETVMVLSKLSDVEQYRH